MIKKNLISIIISLSILLIIGNFAYWFYNTRKVYNFLNETAEISREAGVQMIYDDLSFDTFSSSMLSGNIRGIKFIANGSDAALINIDKVHFEFDAQKSVIDMYIDKLEVSSRVGSTEYAPVMTIEGKQFLQVQTSGHGKNDNDHVILLNGIKNIIWNSDKMSLYLEQDKNSAITIANPRIAFKNIDKQYLGEDSDIAQCNFELFFNIDITKTFQEHFAKLFNLPNPKSLPDNSYYGNFSSDISFSLILNKSTESLLFNLHKFNMHSGDIGFELSGDLASLNALGSQSIISMWKMIAAPPSLNLKAKITNLDFLLYESLIDLMPAKQVHATQALLSKIASYHSDTNANDSHFILKYNANHKTINGSQIADMLVELDKILQNQYHLPNNSNSTIDISKNGMQ